MNTIGQIVLYPGSSAFAVLLIQLMSMPSIKGALKDVCDADGLPSCSFRTGFFCEVMLGSVFCKGTNCGFRSHPAFLYHSSRSILK